jgi:hypothetical protein
MPLILAVHAELLQTIGLILGTLLPNLTPRQSAEFGTAVALSYNPVLVKMSGFSSQSGELKWRKKDRNIASGLVWQP